MILSIDPIKSSIFFFNYDQYYQFVPRCIEVSLSLNEIVDKNNNGNMDRHNFSPSCRKKIRRINLLYPGKVDSEALLFQSTKRALKFIKRE